MKNILVGIFLIALNFTSCTQKKEVQVYEDELGMKLIVKGENFIINGMNWDYFPIGTNYAFSIWQKPDAFIKTALHNEMTLLKEMGVNTIRVYTGIQPKWITYIYEKYGIYTMLNHSFGRYGYSHNGKWIPATDYDNKNAQEALLSEIEIMAKEYKNTPGLLLYLLGNENNYGLFWSGAETEDFPDDENEKEKIGETRGRALYKLMNKAAIKIKSLDKNHPVAICNGDVLYIDIVAEECKDVDIYGTNMYRGKSFDVAFETVKNKLNKPILFTEFGADAYNAIENKEDQKMQAFYMVENWKEIYQNAYGLKKAQNSIGGFTFQFSDGWWKYKQDYNLNIQDTVSTWANGGYALDFVKGKDNMNEEWFGICAKGKTDQKGFYQLKPRAAYYALQEVHKLNPLNKESNQHKIINHFNKININNALTKALTITTKK